VAQILEQYIFSHGQELLRQWLLQNTEIGFVVVEKLFHLEVGRLEQIITLELFPLVKMGHIHH
jgi:hypothetical protein